MGDASFIQDLYSLFERTITIEPFSSQTIAGKPSYGAAVTYAARIIMKDVGVRTMEGTIIVGRGTVYLPGVYTVTVRDRLTMPGGIPGPVQPPILSVSVTDDEFSGSYTTLVIG